MINYEPRHAHGFKSLSLELFKNRGRIERAGLINHRTNIMAKEDIRDAEDKADEEAAEAADAKADLEDVKADAYKEEADGSREDADDIRNG